MCRTMPEPVAATLPTEASNRPSSNDADGRLLGEDGQHNLVVIADKADEAVGLVALEIGIAHHHHCDWGGADLGVSLRDGQRLHIERDLVEGRRVLLDRSQA